MSDVVHNAQHEFWRPPAGQPEAAGPTMVEACDGCGTEFMVGARFCHVCGGARQAQLAVASSWTRFLEFQYIKQGLGLGTASLIAFFLGLGCIGGVLAVGMIYTIQTFTDFQAIQMYRMEWLLAAVAAFVAGILLKKTSPN
ncbi:MAG: hypothetical protein LAO03_08190 [Acidobacteriia bacterium]|nr:hypothetical protein [Terriglobia bacterium]